MARARFGKLSRAGKCSSHELSSDTEVIVKNFEKRGSKKVLSLLGVHAKREPKKMQR